MVTFEQLKLLEKYLDQAWKMLGIDVSFTKHFLERANDPRNGKPIDIRELQKLFVDAYKRYGSMFARMKLGDNEIEGVLTDLSTKINSPFVLSWDKRTREFDLRAKTVMRKNNFVPNNPRERKYTVEDRNSNSHMWSDYDRSSGPTWTDWIAKKIGTKKWVVANQLTDKLKEKGYKVAISQAKYSELNKQFKSLHEEQERKQMSLNKRFGVSDEFAKIANAIAEETYKQREEEARALAEASKAKMAELLGEDVEQIDELSKSTLGSYIHKAASNSNFKRDRAQDNFNRVSDAKGDEEKDKFFNRGNRLLDKSNQRTKGIQAAAKKLAKEDLDEAFDNGPGDKRAAEIKKELDADFKKKKTFKEKFKKFRQELHYATNVSKLPKHLQDDVQEDVVDEDCLKVNIPLLIRLLEFAREDAKDDVALHKAVERMTELSKNGEKELTMTDYSSIMEDCGVLSELSKRTLGNYVRYASDDKVNHSHMRMSGIHKKQETSERKMRNRHYGIDRAVDKLTKEDVEQIDELRNVGTYHVVNSKTNKAVFSGKYSKALAHYEKVGPGHSLQSDKARMKLAKMAKEDVEQIDELSGKTLDAYYDKASKSKMNAHIDRNNVVANASRNQNTGNTKRAEVLKGKARDLDRVIKKRGDGMYRAAKKLNAMGENVEQIDEISKGKLRDYIERSKEDRDEVQPFLKKSPWKRTQEKADRNIANRTKGIELARKKLKESAAEAEEKKK